MKPTDLKRPADRFLGQPVDRVDALAKVTGQAKYAAEYNSADLLYGYVISSSIAKGKITHFNDAKALGVEGVIKVFSHKSRPNLAWFNRQYKDEDAPPGQHFRALYDDRVLYSGQPIGLVVASSFEAARYAAALVEVSYSVEPHQTDLEVAKKDAYEPKKIKPGFEKPSSRGDADEALKFADHQIEQQYRTPMHHHNPMELFASTVMFDSSNDSYTIYDKTQGTMNSQQYVMHVFGLAREKVRVLTPYMGGGFGSGLRPQYQLYLAMMAATDLQRSVRVVLTRQQMFSFGHRPKTQMQVTLGADRQAKLRAVKHSVVQETSQFEDYEENIVSWAGMLYSCENVSLEHKLAKLDSFTPLDMRAPGAATGVFALECAMDELAYELGVDPLELRMKNFAIKDELHKNRPFSSKELMACYRQGAEKFGWSDRIMEARSLKEGTKLVGWGMATGVWDAQHMKAKVDAEFSVDGKLKITTAITDIGTGTYTVLTQIAAETLGLEMTDVEVQIGDTNFPEAPLQGGSWTASTVGTAAQLACVAVAQSLFRIAQEYPELAFAKASFEEMSFADGYMSAVGAPGHKVSLKRILELCGRRSVKEEGSTIPNMVTAPKHAKNTHSAIFVEVEVDEDYGMVEVKRVVIAIAAGRILNPKTARSQIIGGVVWGISHALHEASVMDHKLGRIMNASFAEYHIPVNRDVPDIEVIFVHEDDPIASPIGVKGVGEIGIVGTAAAVVNAIFHATGRRVRELPVHLDDLL